MTFGLGAVFIDESCCASGRSRASPKAQEAACAAMRAAGLADNQIHVVSMEDLVSEAGVDPTEAGEHLRHVMEVRVAGPATDFHL